MYCTAGTAAGTNPVVSRGAVVLYPPTGAGAGKGWAAFTEDEFEK
jgi:hypothetical protein